MCVFVIYLWLGYLISIMQSNPISFRSFKAARNPIVRYKRNKDVDEIFETAKEKMRKLGTKYGIKLYVSGF